VNISQPKLRSEKINNNNNNNNEPKINFILGELQDEKGFFFISVLRKYRVIQG